MNTLCRRFACHLLVVLAGIVAFTGSALALSWTEQTTPATDQLRDVWAADGANIWVVGNGGRIVKGDGSGNWALQTSGVTNPLIEVWGTSATNLWAVGGSGRILRSTNGTSWATETSGTTNTLFSLWGSSATNVWAAGDQSTLTRWNGTSWTASSLGVGVNMVCHGLWGTAANNIWMVGTHINTGNGMVYRYNGTAWSPDTSMGTVAGLNDVWGTSASDVWAVGNGGLILRWNGTAWTTSPSGTTQDLLSIWGSSATDVYATSAEGGIFHYDGISWTAETSGSIERLNAVIGTSASAVYVAGGSFQVATILAGAPPPPNAAPVIRNTFGGEVPATFAENLAENTPFSGTLIATDADLPAQTLTWTKDGADEDKFTLNPTTGAYALNTLNGTLDFETRTDADMNGIYEVTFTVTDSGTSPATDSVALSITVTDENDAPTVSAIGPQSTNEDTPKTIAFTVGDQDAGQSVAALVVTATVRVADRALIPQTEENIVLGGSGASRTLTLTPAADLSGTAEITVTVSDGTASTSSIFTLTVNAVNDAPSFTLPVNITRFPGSGAYTQAGVVSAISPGPADESESGQNVTFSITDNDNPGLFTVAPTLAANGSLSFAPGSAPGVSTLTVRAQDDGGTANGGVNFTEHTFTITTSVLNSRLAGEVWTARESNRAWYSITSSADGSKLAAVVNQGQIYTSTDSGVTWTARESNRNWNSITSSADGSKLAAVVGGGYVYTSTDSGETWVARMTSGIHQWTSITSSADGSKLAAVSGGQIYTSTDSGETWTARMTDALRLWTSITSSADGSKLAAVVFNGQIYTSTDSGETWTARESNRGWRSITSSADGSRLAAVYSGIVLQYNTIGVCFVSTDSGVTWASRDGGFTVYQTIASSTDGRKLVVGSAPGRTFVDGGISEPDTLSVNPSRILLLRDAEPKIERMSDATREWQSITSSADGSKLAAVAFNGQIWTSEGSSLPDVAAGRAFTQANFTSADASSNIVSYQVTNNNPALFAVQPAIDTAGTLTLTAGRNAGTAIVTVTAVYNGGADTTSAQTFTVNVTKPLKVNERFFVATNELPAVQDRLIAAGETFVGVFFGSYYGAGSGIPLVLSGPDAALFQLDPVTGFLEFKTVPVFPNPRIGTPEVPSSYFYDVTLSIGSATSPLGIATARLRISNTDVNDMPSFTKGADLSLPATLAPQIIPGWATGIDDGDSLANQALSFTVTRSSGPELLSAGPTIDPATGNLSFTPSGSTGTATYSVTLTDDASINGGAALTTAGQTFTITIRPPPPTLTSVAPAIGSTLGGTPVTLTGTNFAGPASVTFGGAAATSVTVVSPTTITATTPARAAGAVSVVVTTPGGTNAPNTLYTYAANSAPVLGATTTRDVTSSRVTLLGTVTYDGGAAVTEQGFIYAPITRSPTPVIGGPGVVQRPSALVAQGLSASESGLQPGTSYALRSYARNTFGLSYSDVTTNFQTGPLLGRLEVRTDDNSVLADNDGYGFGNAATGATKVRTLTVRNVGTTRLINIVAAITGANVASFTRTLPSTTLEPGASMNVAVSFLPAALGTATATVAFSSSETSQPPLRVNLSGNGVPPGAAALSVKVGDTQITDNVGSVDYGSVPLSTSAERVFTLTNTGANNLTGLVLSVIGTHKADVTLSPLTATVLSAGDSVSFTAYLTPGAVGARSATILIKSNDSTAQPFFDIPVTATGIVPEIEVLQGTTNIVDNSTTVSFGTAVPVGTNSVRSFTVKNLGTSTLTLGAISFDGLHAADFTATVPASLSLAQNASTTFDVTFRPSSGGARTAALHLLTSDANESPFDIKLSGTGIGPEISVAAGTVQLTSGGPAIDFGEVITATSSVARTYTLKNLGNAPLTGISVSSDSPRFVVGGTPAATLDAGKTTTFTLTFSPNEEAPFTGTISIVSNDFDEGTFTLPVIGKGAANTPPTINPGPQDQIIALGQPVTFAATVTSPLTFTRQWRKGAATFANIAGATAATFTINEVKLTDAQKYQLRATNTAGNKLFADSTPAAALTVVDRTATSQTLQTTKMATFTISAATAPGSTLTYLWKKDGGALPGNASAAGNKLTLTNLVLANAGTYTCEVTGPGGTMTGGDQVLTVYDSKPVISSTPAPSPSLSLKAFAAAAPSDITLTLPEAFLESDYTYQITLAAPANGSASNYSCTGLPPGLRINTTTGQLYGLPVRAGSYPLTFKASNSLGFSTATGTLTVSLNLGNSVTGSYLGLIERGPLTGNLGGRLDMTVTIDLSISGKLTLGSSAVSFRGRLASGGLSTSITVLRTGLPNLTLTLAVDSANNRFAASGCTLTDGTNTSAFSGWRVVWSTLNAPTTYLGAYNFAMSAPASSPVDTIPLGHGYSTLSVQAKGALTTAGRLPDGDTFTTSSQLGPNGEVALFNVVTGRSSLHGSTQINPGATNAANTLATGSLTWTRPATTIGATTKTTLYAAGFGPIALTCEGGRYTAPVAPGLLMGKAPGTGNAMLRFYDANIGGSPSPADCAVTLTTSGATVVTPTFTRISITGTTGIFTGSFTLTNNHPFLIGAPVIKRTVTFNGLIIPTASGQRGYGYFLLPQLPVNTFPTPPTPSLSGGVELE